MLELPGILKLRACREEPGVEGREEGRLVVPNPRRTGAVSNNS